MNYLNIHTDLLRSEDYLGAEPVERATWLNLASWCATQENGGVIENAADWKDRKWQQICGVTLEEIQLSSNLYHFTEAGSLVVHYYPVEKEAEVKQARKNGKKGGRPTKEKPTNKPGGYEAQNPDKTPWVDSVKTEGKGRERKGNRREIEGKEKGKEREETSPAPPQNILSLPHSDFLKTGDIETIKAGIQTAYPKALPAYSKREATALHENRHVLESIDVIEWDLLRIWTTQADEKARGCRLWPSNRSQFLQTPGEAIEKVKTWWSASGHNWWQKRIEREKKKADRLAGTTTPTEAQPEAMSPAEALEYLKS